MKLDVLHAPFEKDVVRQFHLIHGFLGHLTHLLHALRQVHVDVFLDDTPDPAVQKPGSRFRQKVLRIHIEVHIFYREDIGLRIE